MTVEDLNGIANVEFGQVETLTWQNQSEWDDAIEREQVVTRSIGDRDADSIEQGYDPNYPPVDTSQLYYYTSDEESGSTANDAFGLNDGSIEGPMEMGVENGILNSTSFRYGGSSDQTHIDTGIAGNNHSTPFTFVCWLYRESTEDREKIWVNYTQGNSSRREVEIDDGNAIQYKEYESSSGTRAETRSISTGTWYHFAMVHYSDSVEFYINGSLDDTGSLNYSLDSSNVAIGSRLIDHEESWPGIIDEPMCVERALSGSEIQSLYNAGSSGFLTTKTKSFSTSIEPSLSNLQYSLNNETIELDIIGSPGTSDEEIVSQVLDGNTAYGLSWTQAHQDFQIEVNLSTADVTTTAEISSITLTT